MTNCWGAINRSVGPLDQSFLQLAGNAVLDMLNV